MKHILALSVGIVIILGFIFLSRDGDKSFGLAVCTVTESVATIGHQESLTIVPAGARSWAIIQQPFNATNTVSISFGNTAVSGRGYTLYSSVVASTTDNLRVGFSTDLPTSVAMNAITNTGSSTINVTVCR